MNLWDSKNPASASLDEFAPFFLVANFEADDILGSIAYNGEGDPLSDTYPP